MICTSNCIKLYDDVVVLMMAQNCVPVSFVIAFVLKAFGFVLENGVPKSHG